MMNWSTALADTIMTRYPNPDDIPYRVWCYVQGYVLTGFEKLWQATGDPRYFTYLKKFVDQHVSEDGEVSGFSGDSMDDMMAGATVCALYEHTGERKYRLAAERIRHAFDDYPRNADGAFWHGKSRPHEFWIDGVFMGGMFLSRYGEAVGHADSCFKEVSRQILTLADRCRKAESGLFLHAYDETKSTPWADPVTGLSCDVWSEGLGWYALILVEALNRIPADFPQRPALLAILRELAAGLLRAQDPHSGLWYQVVDKGSRPDNWHDTSGSAMFVYMLQRAGELGYIPPETALPAAQRGYAGICSKARVNEQGLVDIYDACDGVCVQDSYSAYIDYPRVVNAKEAVGGFLWATTAVEKPGETSKIISNPGI